MPSVLRDRIAIVTGASAGIGSAVALELHRAGAWVACLARRKAELETLAARIESEGGRALAITCDVTSGESVAAAVLEAARLGPPDILVNNAGIAKSAPFLRTTLEDWQATLDVNLTGAYRMTQAVLPAMLARKSGRIINVASVAGKVGFLYTSAYCASKHGMVGLTRALALELAPSGITVNAVCPGWVDTEMAERAIANIHQKTGQSPDDARRGLASMSPQGRLMTAGEVAYAVVALAGDEARGINGQTLVIDGGGCQA